MRVAFPRYPGTSRKTHYLDLLGRALVGSGHRLVAHGYDEAPPADCDFAVFWGFKNPIRQRAEDAGMPFLACEMPYFGNRHSYASLGWNHFGRKAIRSEPGATRRPQPKLRPWTASDSGPVVVFGQCPRDYSTRDVDMEAWAVERCLEARRMYQRAVVYRQHPHELAAAGDRNAWDTEAFLEASRAWLAVSYSSTAAIKSVCMGVPTIVEHPESMAWDVAGHSLGERLFPEREQWAHWLSYCQWSEEEFADGTALSHMLKAYDEARADADR